MAKVTAKYQITLPKNVRNELGIVPGAEVDIRREGKRYVLVVDPIERIKSKWCGRIKAGKSTVVYMEQIRGPV